MKKAYLVTFFFSISFVCLSAAAPRFSNLFAENAVLQRGQTIAVTGFDADSTKPLAVRLGESTVSAKVSSDGSWVAILPAHKASGIEQSLELLVNDKIVETIAGIVVGDVWLAAGQSNMQMQVRSMLKQMPSAKPWVDSANIPNVRFRRVDDNVLVDRNAESTDLNNPEPWVKMNSKTVLNFSATAAVFARELATEIEVPIGIIDISWGGKPIEPFIPRESFSTPFLKSIKDLADAEKLDQLKSLEGGVNIRNPEGYPGSIFNARMTPITKYKLAGFIWYQAESNAGRGEDPRKYSEKMQALATGWRARWETQSLPFYYVQLPSFPSATGWIRVREEQRRALGLIPNSAMAVTIDIRGEGIHPPDKIELGKRLAKCALKGAYQKEHVVASGPTYKSHSVEGDRLTIKFTNYSGGLAVGNRPEFSAVELKKTRDINWFELAGKDGKWHSAQAAITGEDRVTISSPSVPNPVAVRYACHTNPQGDNLYNRSGLPASPFCSDLKLLEWQDQEAAN